MIVEINAFLHFSSPCIGPAERQIANFLQQIRQTDEAGDNLHQLVALLNGALKDSVLAEFGPKLLPFGSLLTGLATFSSDLDSVLHFENLNLDVIDFDTSMLVLEVVRPILNQKLGFQISEKFIYPSRRCPIISMQFASCLPNAKIPDGLRFHQCDIR